MIPIKGFQKTSLIDYPGKMCSVVFVANCNFRCPYCHNPDLVLNHKNIPDMPAKKIFEHLKKKKKWIDGVCITGGEPCLHENLVDFIRKLKSMGFLVKLDTNGTNPEMLKHLLRNKLLDYVAMDVKGPLKKYSRIVNANVKIMNIRESASLLMKSGVDYEFRTTVVPSLFNEDDLVSIGKWLRGAKKYCIQQFRTLSTLDKKYEKEKPYPEQKLRMFAEVAKEYFGKVEVRA